MAVSFYVNNKLEHNSLPEAGLHTTLETLLQAQQAVMIATITDTASAANSSSDSSSSD